VFDNDFTADPYENNDNFGASASSPVIFRDGGTNPYNYPGNTAAVVAPNRNSATNF